MPTIFRCAIELAEAASSFSEEDWGDLPASCQEPGAPHFDRQIEASRRLIRIEEESERLKRLLGATGSLQFQGDETTDEARWESYHQRFNNSSHDRVVRMALVKLATATLDLSGFATWRECHWHMRASGLRLLTLGLAQLWEGLSDGDRSSVRDRLKRAHSATGWPTSPEIDPPIYDGPEEIPSECLNRVVENFITCSRERLDEIQKADNQRFEYEKEKFLRDASIATFLDLAEQTVDLFQRLENNDCDTPADWAKAYQTMIAFLAYLQRAHEVPPSVSWPTSALEARKVIADSANVLFRLAGGCPETKAGMCREDVDKAFERIVKANSQLRDATSSSKAEPPIFDPADTSLNSSTIANAKALLAYVESLATTNTTMRQMVLAFGERFAGSSAPAVFQSNPISSVHSARKTLKRSTEKGEAREKLVAALTLHHKYADGGCLNLDPIGNNAIAKAAGVSPSTASAFFADEFKGHMRYKFLCKDRGSLVVALKILNQEIAPHQLLGAASADLAAPEEEDMNDK